MTTMTTKNEVYKELETKDAAWAGAMDTTRSWRKRAMSNGRTLAAVPAVEFLADIKCFPSRRRRAARRCRALGLIQAAGYAPVELEALCGAGKDRAFSVLVDVCASYAHKGVAPTNLTELRRAMDTKLARRRASMARSYAAGAARAQARLDCAE